MATVLEVGTPEWWLDSLSKELDGELEHIARFEAYYAGLHNLRFATPKFREAFGGLFREFSDNWCEVVVDATVERLAVQGFRFGGATGTGDSKAWDIWQRNSLDCDSEIAHTQAMVAKRCAVIVGPQDDGSTTVPRITVEHPSQVIVRHAAGDRRQRAAALKRWRDDMTGRIMATLYLPNEIFRFQSRQTVKEGESVPADIRWEDREDATVYTTHQWGVPVVPITNKQGLLDNGSSEIEQVIPMQDLVNKLLTDMTVASEFAAYRQRVLMGVEVPRYPDDYQDASLRGRPIPNTDVIMSMTRLLMIEEPDAKLAEFSATDLSNYINAVKMARDHIAARTRTPPHYLLGEIVNASGDALKAAETGLVSKARRRMRFFGESWEEVMRLAFAVRGDKGRSQSYGAETIWADPENVTEAQRMDALVKMESLGVPRKALWQRMPGVSQAEVDEWEKMAADQAAQTPAPVDPEAAVAAAVARAASHDV